MSLKDKIYEKGLKSERVIDPIVATWIEEGYGVENIDTWYTLSQSIEGIERGIKFQVFVQQYVDNGISSTMNLPNTEKGLKRVLPQYLSYLCIYGNDV